MNEQRPLRYSIAAWELFKCVATTVRLLLRRRIHLPKDHVGMRLRFADGTSARVYRETVVDRAPMDPCVLLVEFRLKVVHGKWAHTLFRRESLLNTPLFVGFPGYVSKLWMENDQHDVYRGVYEWDGAERAERYARSLWRVLALVSVRGSIHYMVLPGLRRDVLLANPHLLDSRADATGAWWRPTEVAA